jgi:hypothetical protein
MNAKQLLHNWLSSRIEQTALKWLEEKSDKITSGAPERVFFTSFSAVPRYTGKADLNLTVEEKEASQKVCRGWFPEHWRVDQVGRTLIVLSLPSEDIESYSKTLEKVFTTADVGELAALYQALPLLPHPSLHIDRAAEGIRSNMTNVFNAVALRNPYPKKHLDNGAWNQLVLKALFIGSPLYLIQGLDERANPVLAQMLVDYAHERWAAKRTVTPELWRPVGKFITLEILPDLERILNEPDEAQQEAAALALANSTLPKAQKMLLNQRPDLQFLIRGKQLTWHSFNQGKIAVKQSL